MMLEGSPQLLTTRGFDSGMAKYGGSSPLHLCHSRMEETNKVEGNYSNATYIRRSMSGRFGGSVCCASKWILIEHIYNGRLWRWKWYKGMLSKHPLLTKSSRLRRLPSCPYLHQDIVATRGKDANLQDGCATNVTHVAARNKWWGFCLYWRLFSNEKRIRHQYSSLSGLI